MIAIASTLSQKPVTIKCDTLKYFGYVWFTPGVDQVAYAEPLIHLHPAVCEGLKALLSGKIDYYYGGDDLETLIHEAIHIRDNTRDEGVVECKAIQSVNSVLTWLGFTAKVRAKLVKGAWVHHNSMGKDSPYRAVC